MRTTVWRLDDELVSPISAAVSRHDTRPRIFVVVDEGEHQGFGEISPLTDEFLGDPSFDEVIAEIPRSMSRFAQAHFDAHGSLEWSRVHLLASTSSPSRWAFAALEMALLDLELTQQSRRLQEIFLPVATTPQNATTSLIEPDVTFSPERDVARVRVKVDPSVSATDVARAASAWDREILLDYNASAKSVSDVTSMVRTVSSAAPIAAVEQPFRPADLISHAALVADLNVRVSLDESVRSVGDLRRISRYQAASLVCVKPPRVGGLAAARSMLLECERLGLAAYLGGFFESPYARRVHRALADSFHLESSDVAPVATRRVWIDVPHEWGLGDRPSLEGATRLGEFDLGAP